MKQENRDAFGLESYIPDDEPKLELQLTGEDGNAFSILGRALKVMKRAGVSKEAQDAFTAEATSGDYDHLLQTVMKTFNVK